MSCDGKLYRRRQVLGKIEEGCAEPAILAAVDGGLEVKVSPQITPQVDMNERDVARISLTKLESIPGEIKGDAQFSAEFKGSGQATVEPSIGKYLEGSSTEKRTLYKIDAPELAGSDILFGSTLVGGTSGGEAVVVVAQDSEEYDGFVYYELTNGTGLASAEVVTLTKPDATTATFTSTVAEAPVGFTYSPISTGAKTMTIRSEEDGYKKEIYGAMGTWTLNADSSALTTFEFTFNGILSKGFIADMTFSVAVGQFEQIKGGTSGALATLVRGVDGAGTIETHFVLQDKDVQFNFVAGETVLNSSNVPVGVIAAATPFYRGAFGDQPMTPGIVFHSTQPPILQNAQLVLDGLDGFKPTFASVSVDAQNEIAVRKNGNMFNGLQEALITGRGPTTSVDPEMMNESDYDVFNKWFEGTPGSIQFRIGRGSDFNSLFFYGKKAQFTNVGDGDRDSVAIVTAEAMLAGSTDDNDDEYKLVFY